MKNALSEIYRIRYELIFQLILHLVVFSFYVVDNNEGSVEYEIEFQTFIYFLNYALGNQIISHILLPRFFYKKKFFTFFILISLLVGIVVLVEQLILDPYFFPNCAVFDRESCLLGLGEAIPVLAILAGFKFSWDAITRQKEVEELKASVRESEVAFLNSQINPHFLFNHLNNLYSYALQDSPKTKTIILEMSSILRYMIYECRDEFVPLKKEIKHLQDFINLNELQIEERGKVEFYAGETPDGLKIAPLILNVFVENAFKHSQSGKAEGIHISVTLDVDQNNRLIFTCKNNFESNNISSTGSSGIGLTNVQRRLDLLYPDQYDLKIRHNGNQFEVHLSIQL
jgi:two-component system LytT family sensor kinase